MAFHTRFADHRHPEQSRAGASRHGWKGEHHAEPRVRDAYLALCLASTSAAVLTVVPGRATLLQAGAHLALLAAYLFLAASPRVDRSAGPDQGVGKDRTSTQLLMLLDERPLRALVVGVAVLAIVTIVGVNTKTAPAGPGSSQSLPPFRSRSASTRRSRKVRRVFG
jgi:hypothetical protein